MHPWSQYCLVLSGGMKEDGRGGKDLITVLSRAFWRNEGGWKKRKGSIEGKKGRRRKKRKNGVGRPQQLENGLGIVGIYPKDFEREMHCVQNLSVQVELFHNLLITEPPLCTLTPHHNHHHATTTIKHASMVYHSAESFLKYSSLGTEVLNVSVTQLTKSMVGPFARLQVWVPL